ncbi:EboA domain-containing protein [Sphaerisporangium corydalis]|uniref:EboA domain-containing protein n=1 Tax=Sphaerisporangium corydalis TaxID=1441875 RepID=A0ABV9EG17_9ACTN|nr:EboA domain-containing protein [Sphaerisporangium corydalis]
MTSPNLSGVELSEDGARWLETATRRIREDERALAALFPAAGRACGRGPIPSRPGWTVDQAVRAELLAALPGKGAALGETLFELYAHGDAAERLAVLKALPLLAGDGRLGDEGLPIVRDALRTNDARLVQAALGGYGADHLSDHAFRQAVLKCVFIGVPLASVSGLDRRADEELARMMADFAEERLRAGREVPPDTWPLMERHPHVLTKVHALRSAKASPPPGDGLDGRA